jgi:hypothetical protein
MMILASVMMIDPTSIKSMGFCGTQSLLWIYEHCHSAGNQPDGLVGQFRFPAS